MLRHLGRVDALVAELGLDAAARDLLQNAPQGGAWKTLQAKLVVWARAAESIASERETLEQKFTPPAFGPEGLEVFAKVSRYAAFLRRRLPAR